MDLLQEVVELRSAGKALQWSRNVGIQNQRAGSRGFDGYVHREVDGRFAPVEPSTGTNFSGKWPTGFDRGQRGRIVLLVTFAGALYTP